MTENYDFSELITEKFLEELSTALTEVDSMFAHKEYSTGRRLYSVLILADAYKKLLSEASINNAFNLYASIISSVTIKIKVKKVKKVKT